MVRQARRGLVRRGLVRCGRAGSGSERIGTARNGEASQSVDFILIGKGETMKTKYCIAKGRSVKGDPNSIGNRLAEIARRNDGQLDPHDVVKDAVNKSSPLHLNFEWSDKKAAHEHRLSQARYLIGSIVEVNIHTQKETRSFVNVTTIADDDGNLLRARSYAPIDTAMSDPALRQRVLASIKQQLKTILRQHADLEELAMVYDAVDAIPA